MSLGATISRLRAEKKLSQGDLADALGVSRQSISKWETDASVPELDKLIKLSQLFGVTLDELVTGETLPEPVPSPVPLPRQMHGQKIAAIILLCMAFLVWLVLAALGGPLEGPHGDQYYVYRDRVGGDAAGVSTKSEHIELALKWLDVLTSDPAVIMTRTCGWEGENYYLDENGDVQLIYPEDGSPWSIGNYGCGQIAMPHYQTYDQMMNSRKNIDWYMDQYNAILDMDCFIHPSVPQMAAYTEEEYELIDMARSDVEAYFKEMRAKFIVGEADIETEWDSYVDTMYALGLQDWIDAEQSIYDRTR